MVRGRSSSRTSPGGSLPWASWGRIPCPSSRYFRLVIHAALPPKQALQLEAKGYFITYDVVAETQDEALCLAREFEDAEFPAADLRVEETEQLEDRPKAPKGVYRWTGRSFYQDEAEG